MLCAAHARRACMLAPLNSILPCETYLCCLAANKLAFRSFNCEFNGRCNSSRWSGNCTCRCNALHLGISVRSSFFFAVFQIREETICERVRNSRHAMVFLQPKWNYSDTLIKCSHWHLITVHFKFVSEADSVLSFRVDSCRQHCWNGAQEIGRGTRNTHKPKMNEKKWLERFETIFVVFLMFRVGTVAAHLPKMQEQ